MTTPPPAITMPPQPAWWAVVERHLKEAERLTAPPPVLVSVKRN